MGATFRVKATMRGSDRLKYERGGENMIRVIPEPMPSNKRGSKEGLWKVVVYDYGPGHIKDKTTHGKIHSENLSYDEARALSTNLEGKLNEAQ